MNLRFDSHRLPRGKGVGRVAERSRVQIESTMMASSQPPAEPGRVLSSWKEVAAHLGVSTRTAQVWEAERGLPVHRAPGGPRGRIFASTAELDAWWQASPLVAPLERKSRFGWIAAAVCACAGIVAGAVYWRSPVGSPSVLDVKGSSLVVFDERGRELWQHRFDGPFWEHADYPRVRGGGQRFRFADLDGDGHVELLFIRLPRDPVSDGATLFCFSDTGKVRWEYKVNRTVRSQKESFPPPYISKAVAVARVGKGRPPVVVVSSVHSVWYPNQVAVLSGDGSLLSEYWHSGQLDLLEASDLNGDGVDEIYAGGTNNDYNQATLVVLDPNQLAGASRESERPDYQLLGFPAPRERARLLLARSCLVVSTAVRNVVQALNVQAGSILVTTGEFEAGGILYRLDRNMKVMEVGATDGFAATHRSVRERGLIDHEFSAGEIQSLRRITTLTP